MSTTTRYYEPPAATIDSFWDRETGALLFQGHGPLFGLPPDPTTAQARPALVAASAELVAEAAGWLAQLGDRQLEIIETASADDRAIGAARLLDEVETSTARLAGAMHDKAGALRTLASSIVAQLAERDPALDTALGQRLGEYFLRLDAHGQAAFLKRAEAEGDHVALGVIATDPMVRYAAPKLDRAALALKAGAARSPNLAALADGFVSLAKRMETNARRLQEAGATVSAQLVAAVDPDKLRLARRSRAA